jgi:hypothetical protein
MLLPLTPNNTLALAHKDERRLPRLSYPSASMQRSRVGTLDAVLAPKFDPGVMRAGIDTRRDQACAFVVINVTFVSDERLAPSRIDEA